MLNIEVVTQKKKIPYIIQLGSSIAEVTENKD